MLMKKPLESLPNKSTLAMAHYRCCYSCIARVENALVEGDYDLVIKRARDLIRSAEELKMLQSEKQVVVMLMGGETDGNQQGNHQLHC